MPKLAVVGGSAKSESTPRAEESPPIHRPGPLHPQRPDDDQAWLDNLETTVDTITQMLRSDGHRAAWLLGFLTGCAIGEGRPTPAQTSP